MEAAASTGAEKTENPSVCIPCASAVLGPEDSQSDVQMAREQVDAEKKRKLEDASTKKSSEEETKYSAMVQKLLGDRISKEMMQNIKKECIQLGRAIERYGKAKTRLANIRSRISSLEEGEWPTGLKPFKFPIDAVEADEILGIEELKVTLGPTMTIREAREKVYKAVTHFYQKCDEKMAEHQVRNYKTDTDYKSYITKCMAPGDRMSRAVADLELDLPPGLFEPRDAITEEKATLLYKSVVELAAQQKIAATEAEKKQKAAKDKLIADIDSMKPEELFERACRQAVGKKGHSKGYSIDYIGMINTNNTQPVENLVTHMPQKDENKKRRWTKQELAQRKLRRPDNSSQTPKNGFATSPPSRYKGPIPSTKKGKGKGKHTSPIKGKSKGKSMSKSRSKGKETQWIPKSPTANMLPQKPSKGKGKGVRTHDADNKFSGFPKGKGKGYGPKGTAHSR